jgi:hypothetical protein
MSEIVNPQTVASPAEADEMDVDLVEFGVASDLTHGSGGRSEESSYYKP